MKPLNSNGRLLALTRRIGWCVIAFSCVFLLFTLVAFVQHAPVTLDGVKRTDLSAKIPFVVFSLIALTVGLECVLAPDQVRHEYHQRVFGRVRQILWQKRLFRRIARRFR